MAPPYFIATSPSEKQTYGPNISDPLPLLVGRREAPTLCDPGTSPGSGALYLSFDKCKKRQTI